MSNSKPNEPLDATTIADSLYAQQLTADEHIDLPGLRRKIAQAIRNACQSADVDEDAIEQGVQRWFANRLRYQPPGLTFRQRAGAYLCMTSARWLTAIIILGLIAALLGGYRFYVVRSELNGLKQSVAAALSEHAHLTGRAQALARRLAAAKKATPDYAGPAAATLIAQTATLLDELNANGKAAAPLAAGASRSEVKQRLRAEIARNNAQDVRLNAATIKLNALTTLLDADKALSAIAHAPAYDTYARCIPELASQVSTAAQALAQGDNSAGADIDKARDTFMLAQSRSSMLEQLVSRITLLDTLTLSPEDRRSVNALLDNARALAQSPELAQQAWDDAMAGLDDTYAFIVTPLTLSIVDRAGESPWVERNDDGSGDGRWYLIVEALTTQGSVFPLTIKDSETGEQKKVSTFGIRISQSEFAQLKDNKRRNGRIDSPLVGSKPANQLGFEYVRPVMEERITGW